MKMFSLDTNVLIEAWNTRYPIDLMPDFWVALDEMARTGQISASDEVLRELEKIDDELYKWARGHLHLFTAPSADVQQHLRRIMKDHPRLVDTKKGRSQADPFVIAHAAALQGAVVTEEISTVGSKSPKIPDVCRAYGIECIRLVEFMRQVKLRFSRA